MTLQMVDGDYIIYELEYYSVGGGFIEWKGYTPPKKGQPKYPYATMKQLRQHAEANNLSIADVILANEIAVSGKSEDQINVFLDKIAAAMRRPVRSGLSAKDAVLPGPIKLYSKAGTVWARANDEKYESDRAIGLVAACALAASEENARGHLVITAPTGGSAGVMPAIVFGLVESKRKASPEQIRRDLLAGAAIGYLCKHRATLWRGAAARLKLALRRRCPPRCSRGLWAVHYRRSRMPPIGTRTPPDLPAIRLLDTCRCRA
jgi:L-serine dehydratase